MGVPSTAPATNPEAEFAGEGFEGEGFVGEEFVGDGRA